MSGAAAGRARSGRILVVGKSSFIARHLLARLPPERVLAVGHGEIDRPGLLDGVGCVINAGRQPIAAGEAAGPDVDSQLAQRIGDRAISYVMLSTRQVYAPGLEVISEGSPTGAWSAYGRQKAATEQALRELLGARLTVLRLGNIFGYERAPPGRRTFLSLLLGRLAGEGRIVYDMSPFVARDFLPVEQCAAILARIVQAPPGGVLNVGSGIALPTGRLALWILEGFGRGELLITSPEERDAFVLDVTRLRTRYGEPCTPADLRAACLAIGRRLAAEASGEAGARASPFD